MTPSSSLLMRPGDRPTEPGWYVVSQKHRDWEVVWIPGYYGGLAVMMIDASEERRIDRFVAQGYTFLAQIFPDQSMEQVTAAEGRGTSSL